MTIFDKLSIILLFFNLMACITGIIYWKQLKQKKWKGFVIYLACIFLLDALGHIIQFMEYNNAWLYNYIVQPFTFVFFYWFFWQSFTNNKFKKWPVTAAVIYVLSFFAGLLWLNVFSTVYMSFAYSIGNILLLILIILFFWRFIKEEDILSYKTNGMFWVCIGLLVYYMGSFPFYGLWNTLLKYYPTIFNTYWVVHIVLDYFMYFFFAIAFIWGKQK